MIKKCFFIAWLLVVPIMSFSQDTIFLRESQGIDIRELMEKNHIYMRRIQDADMDKDCFYILDDEAGTVLRIDKTSGRLINQISSKGQGPTELMMPSVLRVVRDKVFILSEGHNSIKIFSIDGKFLGEVRARGKARWMDVDQNENVYIAESDSKAIPTISVYDNQGQFLRTAVFLNLSKEILEDKIKYIMHSMMKFRVDRDGNIYILNHLLQTLKKFGPKGNLLWEIEISNPLIEPSLKKVRAKRSADGVTISTAVFNLDIDEEGNAYIGHAGGGCVYNSRGQLINLLEVQSIDQKRFRRALFIIRVFNDKIFGGYNDGSAYLFNLR